MLEGFSVTAGLSLIMSKTTTLLSILLLPSVLLAQPANTPPRAAIASAHPLATQAGMAVLQQGGNAFDAAVAVAATLGVVEPYSSGIGGGSFWLLYDAKKQKSVMIDAREAAPLSASEDMYLDKQGNVDRDRSINGPLAAGIPGQPAALAWVTQHYGQLQLKTNLAAAIGHARNGFPMNPVYERMLGARKDILHRYPASADLWQPVTAKGKPALIQQTQLASTLTVLANRGHQGFYTGSLAKTMVSNINADGGQWSLQDLANYQVIEREPIVISYRDATITSAAPPSSGGLVLAEIFNMLEATQYQHNNNPEQIAILVEAMRRAYFDRARYMGDPDFVSMPTAQLTSKDYAAQWAQSITPNQATPSSDLGLLTDGTSGSHTTHFSVLDKAGNRVSVTASINLPFGSGYTIPGTGVLLNDEMDDFSAKPGEPNAYGLVGSEANAIAPGKRPLSSMSPSFVETDGAVAILGTPGGSRIITMVLLGSLTMLNNQPVEDWVSTPRYHHQYLPDTIQYEPGALSPEQIKALRKMGYSVKDLGRQYGNMQAVLWDKANNTVSAASDPRGIGTVQLQ